MKFERSGSPIEKLGVGRLRNAEPIHAIYVDVNKDWHLFDKKYIPPFLRGLERGSIEWTLIDSGIPIRIKDGDLIKLRLLMENHWHRKDTKRGSQETVWDSWTLSNIRGIDVSYDGKVYSISKTL